MVLGSKRKYAWVAVLKIVWYNIYQTSLIKVLFNVLIIVAVSMVKTIDILTTFVIQHCVVVMQTVKLILNLSCKTPL